MKKQTWLIQDIVYNFPNKDLLFQFELVTLLFKRPDLLGFICSLIYLKQVGYINFKTQGHIAKLLGMSEPTFIKKKKELESMKLAEVHIDSNKLVINLNILSRLKNFKSVLNPIEQAKYLDTIAKSITPASENEGQMSLSHSIYISNTSNTNTNNTNNDSDINTNTNNKHYAKEDYNIVLEAFKKYKGVGLFGPEINQCLRAIKTMFKSERKPKEIIEFMKWLHDNENNEQCAWVKTWTIWTVQKKINEFVAGKLKVNKTTEDEYPEYGK